MIIVIIGALTLICLFFGIIANKKNPYSDWGMFLKVFGFIFSVATIIMIVFFISAKTTSEAHLAAGQQRYESLIYQAENIKYDNDNDLGKKELANEIREWNEEIAHGRVMQHHWLFGVFYYDIYDDLDFISLDVLK